MNKLFGFRLKKALKTAFHVNLSKIYAHLKINIKKVPFEWELFINFAPK